MNSDNTEAVTPGRGVTIRAESHLCLRLARSSFSVMMGITLAALSGAPLAQTVTVTPTQGQSPQQVETDRQQCHASAVQRSGYDPAVGRGVRWQVLPRVPWLAALPNAVSAARRLLMRRHLTARTGPGRDRNTARAQS